MDSMPPAAPKVTSPRRIDWPTIMTALSPEPQTLLTVVAPTSGGTPAGAPPDGPGTRLWRVWLLQEKTKPQGTSRAFSCFPVNLGS